MDQMSNPNTMDNTKLVLPASKNHVSPVEILALVILVILVGLIGYVLGSGVLNNLSTPNQSATGNEAQNSSNNEQINQTDDQTGTDSTSSDTHINTYTNTAYKYEINYPDTWKSVCSAAGCNGAEASPLDLNPMLQKIGGSTAVHNITIDPNSGVQVSQPNATVTKKVINNIEMQIIEFTQTYTDDNGEKVEGYYMNFTFENINNDNKSLTIYTRDDLDRSAKTEIEEIVSTFKFL